MQQQSSAEADNTVFYELYLSSDSDIKLATYLAHVLQKFGNIRWAVGKFNLCASKDCPDLLIGETTFNTNTVDEWLVIHILYSLSKLDEDLVIRVYDKDGSILLIEAAEHLPSWLNSRESDIRAFIHRGHLHIVPRDVAIKDITQLSCGAAMCQAVAAYIRNNYNLCKKRKLPIKTLANPEIQSAIRAQLQGLPNKDAWIEKRLQFLDRIVSYHTLEQNNEDFTENLESPKKKFKDCLTLEKVASMTEEELEVSSETSIVEDSSDEYEDEDKLNDFDDEDLDSLDSEDEFDVDFSEEIQGLEDAFNKMCSDEEIISYMRAMDSELDGTKARQ